MSPVYLTAGCRTPIGKFMGGLASLSAPHLAAAVIPPTLARAGWPGDQLDEVLLGNVISAGVGQAPARQAALFGGIPSTVPAATINKVCGSGMYAVILAARAIQAGDAQAILAGGMESMSRAPHLLFGGRSGWKYGPQTMLDAIEHDGLRCQLGDSLMGCYAQDLAAERGISRRDQDAWAASSHALALAAQAAGAWQDEIVPMTVQIGKQTVTVNVDEAPREDSTLEKLAKLPAVFARDTTRGEQRIQSPDDTASVTAGNASPLSDGAATLLVVNESVRGRLAAQPLFRIRGYANTAVAPSQLFTAPVGAMRLALERANVRMEQVDFFEINEAFAVQTLACQRELGIPRERLNVQGGAVALGHPIGCSGARILVTLMHLLSRQNKTLGVAAVCLGGGEALAMVVERVG